MRAVSLGLLTIALGAVPLACGAPFTSDGQTTTTGTGGSGSGGAATGTGGATGSGGHSGSTGVGAGGSSSSSSGTGGQKPECLTASDCPGTDSECKMRTCTKGVCGVSTPMALTPSQLWGDCKARGCDGQGNLLVAISPDDVYDDGNACTADTCNGQNPENKVVQQGTPCDNGVCNNAGSCVQCVEGSMCPVGKKNCVAGHCLALHCLDNFQDMGETAVDCGGECLPCKDGLPCGGALDCMSGVCQGQPKVCKPADCNDGVRNGNETDVDCGGKCAAQSLRCNPGQHCALPDDCKSQVCQAGFCQMPICTDGVKNGGETDIDCGGSCGPCLSPG